MMNVTRQTRMMTNAPTLSGKVNPNVSIRVRVGHGSVVVFFIESKELPTKVERIICFSGKAGSELSAWNEAVTTLINYGLDNGSLDLPKVITLLEGIISNIPPALNGDSRWVYSGVGGLVHAIRKYLKLKEPKSNGRLNVRIER